MFSFKIIFFTIIILIIIYLVFFKKTEYYTPSVVNGQSIMNIASIYNLNKNTVFNNIDVTNTVTANDVIIEDTLNLNNYKLNIDSSGVLIISDNFGTMLWSSEKLIGSSLYDPTGRYAFLIDYGPDMKTIGDTPTICTQMYDTNVDGFGLQKRIPNVSYNGGITDESGQYLLSVNKQVWYNTPGIQLQDCFDLSFNQWPIIDLGIKQGQLNYNNTFIVPLEYSTENPHSGLELYYTGSSEADPQSCVFTYR